MDARAKRVGNATAAQGEPTVARAKQAISPIEQLQELPGRVDVADAGREYTIPFIDCAGMPLELLSDEVAELILL